MLWSLPNWSMLRSIGNSRLVQLSATFPLVGYLILFNDEVAKFLSMAALDRPASNTFIEVVWKAKLYFLYFGLMAMGIASIIYQMRCPPTVKKHADWQDYVRIDGESMSETAARELGADLHRDYYEECQRDKPDNVIIDYMRESYELQSNAWPRARAATAALFGIGFCLLAIPSAASAVKIMIVLYHRAIQN